MSYENTTPSGARALLEASDHAVVDVRTVEEFEAGHVPGAYNVPLMFKGMLGMTPNPEFLAVMQRRFRTDEKLVFV